MIKYYMYTALNLEPYIMKKGATNPEHALGDKHFEQFIMSSNMAMKEYNPLNPYGSLNQAVKANQYYFRTTRMWGAIELLFPYATAQCLKYHSFLNYITHQTGIWDVNQINYAREMHWSNSKKPYKQQYERIRGKSITEHYVGLLAYGHEQDQKLVTTWCEEILRGLPTVDYIVKEFSNFSLHHVLNAIVPKVWDNLIDEDKFVVGQLADFIVVALFHYLVDMDSRKATD